jgi:hypothetical protein
MKDLLISNLSMCFKESQKPILIFCDWKDAIKIKLDIEFKMLNGMNGNFINTIKLPPLSCFSCMMEGKIFIFIDVMQTEQFLEIYKKK